MISAHDRQVFRSLLATMVVTVCCLAEVSPASAGGTPRDKVAMYLSQGRPEAALALLDSIIAANPDDADAYSSRAFVYLKMERQRQAVDDFTTVIRLRPADPGGWLSRGMVYDQVRDRERARADYRQACALGDRSGCSFLEQMK